MEATLELPGTERRNPNQDVPLILIVDDSRTGRKIASTLITQELGLRTCEAENGLKALERIEEELPALILTDLQMPEMDGLELMDILQSRYPGIPVILTTAHGSEEITLQALQSGAASYVPKRSMPSLLVPTVEKVLSTSQTERRRSKILECLQSIDATYQLDNDPTLVPHFISHVQEFMVRLGICNENGKIRVGVALEEAILNGLYHGNLELSSDLKQDGSDLFHRVAAERRLLAPYADRRLHVHVQCNPIEAIISIRDEGPGFDISKLPDPTNPENLLMASGRGILLIRTFMDEVNYNESGNEITMIKRKKIES